MPFSKIRTCSTTLHFLEHSYLYYCKYVHTQLKASSSPLTHLQVCPGGHGFESHGSEGRQKMIKSEKNQIHIYLLVYVCYKSCVCVCVCARVCVRVLSRLNDFTNCWRGYSVSLPQVL